MCRFLAYKGSPIVIHEMLYEPQNSLIRQSVHALEREEPLNGDGFGIGWYQKDIDALPAIFTSIQPAWSNQNLRYLSRKIRTDCLFAHVRAATLGNVSQGNCHPFQSGPFLMMHNGAIGGFQKIRRDIVRALSDESFTWLQGQTDSQHLFALFLDEIKVESNAVGKFKILTALQKTISRINAWSKAAGITEPSTLNLAVTDGQSLVATRYVNRLDAKANTLYYSAGNSYECHDGVCMMKRTNPEDSCVLVVSEKLTDIRNDWNEVAVNHAVLVDEDLKVSIAPLNLDSKSQ